MLFASVCQGVSVEEAEVCGRVCMQAGRRVYIPSDIDEAILMLHAFSGEQTRDPFFSWLYYIVFCTFISCRTKESMLLVYTNAK